MGDIYILIDVDRHRDDILIVYLDKAKALKEAVVRTKALKKKWKTEPHTMTINCEAEQSGWFYFAEFIDGSYSVMVRRAELRGRIKA